MVCKGSDASVESGANASDQGPGPFPAGGGPAMGIVAMRRGGTAEYRGSWLSEAVRYTGSAFTIAPWVMGPWGMGPWVMGPWVMGPWVMGPWVMGPWVMGEVARAVALSVPGTVRAT